MDVGSTYSPHYERGTREIFDELQSLYSIYDAAEKVSLSVSSLPHDYDFFHRRATYDWFNRWLHNAKAGITEAPFEEAPASDLNCTSTGQILSSVGGRTAYQINSGRARSRNQIQSEQIQRTLRGLLGISSQASAARARTLSVSTRPDLVIEEFEFFSEPEVRVPGWFLKPAGAASKLPAVLFLSGSKNHLFDDFSLLRTVVDRKIAICAIDSRASGQATPRLPSSGPLFYSHSIEMGYSTISLIAGQPLAGQRVWDAICCFDYLQARPDVDPSRIAVFGTGPSGLDALFAAALENRIRAALLDRTLSDFESLVASEDYNLKLASFVPGLLQHFDLPEICTAIAPRPLWLLNPVDPKDAGLPLSRIMEVYANAAKTYAESQHPTHLCLQIESDPGKVFTDWVQTVLL